MKAAKIVSILLIAVLTVSCLTSCDYFIVSAVEKADQALIEDRYTLSYYTNFTSENKDINEALAYLESANTTMTFDGDNALFNVEMMIDGADASASYTIIEDTLYVDMTVTKLGRSQSFKCKAYVTDEDLEKLPGTENAASDVDFDDFEGISMKYEGDCKIITCTLLSEEEIDDLEDMIAEQLESLHADVSLGDVKFVIKIEDDKYKSVKLTCDYDVSIDNESHEVTMQSFINFYYEKEVEISIPSGADNYDVVDFDDLFD